MSCCWRLGLTTLLKVRKTQGQHGWCTQQQCDAVLCQPSMWLQTRPLHHTAPIVQPLSLPPVPMPTVAMYTVDGVGLPRHKEAPGIVLWKSDKDVEGKCSPYTNSRAYYWMRVLWNKYLVMFIEIHCKSIKIMEKGWILSQYTACWKGRPKMNLNCYCIEDKFPKSFVVRLSHCNSMMTSPSPGFPHQKNPWLDSWNADRKIIWLGGKIFSPPSLHRILNLNTAQFTSVNIGL